MSKIKDIADSVTIGEKENGEIEGNLGDGDIEALRGVVDEEKKGTSSWKVISHSVYGKWRRYPLCMHE